MYLFLLKVTCLCLSVLGGQNILEDVRTTVNMLSRTATVTWKLQKNVKYTYVGIRRKGPQSKDFLHGYIYPPSSTFKSSENMLDTCNQYSVRLQSVYLNGSYSPFVEQDFFMTDKIHRVLVGGRVDIAWDSPLSEIYDVELPSGQPIFTSRNSTTNPNVSFVQNGQDKFYLRISYVDEIAAGMYKIRTHAGEIGCALLIVYDFPKTPTMSVFPAYPFVGEKARFTCKSTVQRWPKTVSSYLTYTFKGFHGIQDGNTLVVDVTDKLSGSTLTCLAKDDYNACSKWSDPLIIVPYYGPKSITINDYVEMINIVEGEDLGPYYCTANCHPPCRVGWRKDGTEISRSVGQSSLIINKISKDKAGTYTCIARHTNANNRYQNKSMDINVLFPAIIKTVKLNRQRYSEERQYSITELSHVTIKVAVEGNPDPVVTLSRSGSPFTLVNFTRTESSYEVNMNYLTCEDPGKYIIVADNGIKNSSKMNLQFNIRCPPRDIAFDNVIIGTMKGAVENITVIVIANPKPSIIWEPHISSRWAISKEGHNKYKGVSQLQIVDERYFRTFVVKIHNKYGTTKANVTITAAGKPDPVQNLTLEELFHNSARISFIAGFDGGEMQTFTLQCTPSGAAELNVIQETIKTKNKRKGLTVYHTIKGLSPETHYNITIISGNIYGHSSAFTYFDTITEPAFSALIPLPVIIGGSVGMVLFLVVVIVLLKMCKKSKKDNCPRNNSPGPDEATAPREGSDTEYACVSKEEKTIESAAGACGGDEYACVVKEPSTSEGTTTATGDNEYAAVDKTGTIKGSIEVHQRQSPEIPVRLQNDDGLLYIQVEFANRKSTKPKDDKPAIRGDDSRTDYVDIDFTKRADPLPESDKDEDDDDKKEEHPDM